MYVLRSQRVVASGKVAPRAVWIDGERIARVADYEDAEGAAYVEDFGDAVIMPGIVDSHVHVNEPGRTEWEGFATATRAAAAGGVTTLVDMPLNSIPATTTVRALEEKAAALEGKCAIDVGLWGGAVPGNAGELRGLLDAGALGFKCFLVDSGVPEFGWVGEADLARAMDVLAAYDAPLLVHAELPGPLEAAKRDAPDAICKSYLRYVASRPRGGGDRSHRALASRVRAHEGPHARRPPVGGRRARHRRAREASEAPVHRGDDAALPAPRRRDDPRRRDARSSARRPFAMRENREALWKGLREGAIDLVVTDHSPCTPELKKLDARRLRSARGAASRRSSSGCRIVWTEARDADASLEDVARWMCEAPAKLAGLVAQRHASPPAATPISSCGVRRRLSRSRTSVFCTGTR